MTSTIDKDRGRDRDGILALAFDRDGDDTDVTMQRTNELTRVNKEKPASPPLNRIGNWNRERYAGTSGNNAGGSRMKRKGRAWQWKRIVGIMLLLCFASVNILIFVLRKHGKMNTRKRLPWLSRINDANHETIPDTSEIVDGHGSSRQINVLTKHDTFELGADNVKHKTLLFVLFSYGKLYASIARILLESIDNYVCNDKPIGTIKVLLFTDFVSSFDSILVKTSEKIKIEIIQHESKGWPWDSMLRQETIYKHASLPIVQSSSHIYLIDSDLKFASPVCDELFVDSAGTIMPWTLGKSKRDWAFESNPVSAAYVNATRAEHYFTGSFIGGRKRWFLDMCENVALGVQHDLKQIPMIIAVWHDESHVNRFLYDNPPKHVLGPEFNYPEPPTDIWMLNQAPDHYVRRDQNGNKHRKVRPKLVHSEKDMLEPEFMVKYVQQKRDVLYKIGRDPDKIVAASRAQHDTTVLIQKQRNPPRCVSNLLVSLLTRYHGANVLIVDEVSHDSQILDSYLIHDNPRIRYVVVRAKSREDKSPNSIPWNHIVEMVKTPYLLWLQESHTLHKRFRIERFIEIARRTNASFIGGTEGPDLFRPFGYNLTSSATTTEPRFHRIKPWTDDLQTSPSTIRPVESLHCIPCDALDPISQPVLLNMNHLSQIRFHGHHHDIRNWSIHAQLDSPYPSLACSDTIQGKDAAPGSLNVRSLRSRCPLSEYAMPLGG